MKLCFACSIKDQVLHWSRCSCPFILTIASDIMRRLTIIGQLETNGLTS